MRSGLLRDCLLVTAIVLPIGLVLGAALGMYGARLGLPGAVRGGIIGLLSGGLGVVLNARRQRLLEGRRP
jgi:hypothetical protein